MEMYAFIRRAEQCFRLLQDALSREIFKARLTLDLEQSSKNIMKIVQLGEQQSWLDAMEKSIPSLLRRVEQEPRKLVLYGTNVTGRVLATLFLEKGIDFYGFCGRRAKEFPDGLMGKPVISPDYLLQYSDDFYVILAMCEAVNEVRGMLQAHHFPQAQILSSLRPDGDVDHQYFEFPALFRRGTAFIDAGCLDCRTSYLFVDWCRGEYSKIYAFEPDPLSASICEKNLFNKEIRDFQFIPAGLSDHAGEVRFRAGLYGGSHIAADGGPEEHTVTVPVTTIDDTVGEDEIGFIKMDIEGAEFDALHGAEKVIVRDKPLLALSVYHRMGDMLAIMDYLHDLVPEYHFWLRHYSIGFADTVLYASVDSLK